MFTHPGAPRCECCRAREATVGRRCRWCAEAAAGDLEDLRGRIYRHFSPRSAKDVSDLLHWLVTVLPTDDEMVRIMACRITTASWCAGESAKALKAAAESLLRFAGFVGNGQ